MATNTIPSHFKGDLEIRPGLDTGIYGLGRLRVQYDAIIGGVLSEINSTDLVIQDNLPTLNYGSVTNGRDIGILGERQNADVIGDTATESGTATAGTLTTITLAAGASAVDDNYNGYVIELTGGTGSVQTKTIIDYDGTTRVATVDSDWTTTPDATSTYSLFSGKHIAIYYDEDVKEFKLGTTPDPHTSDNIDVTLGDLRVNNLIIEGTVTGASEIVTLIDNSATPEDIEATDTRGSYFIVVESVAVDGATATFAASSNEDTSAGTTDRITSQAGANGEEIDIVWNASSKIQLFHSVTSGVGTSLDYTVRAFDTGIAGGEQNDGANIGTDGVGPYDGKTGTTLNFRNIAPASSRISVALDAGDKDIDIDVVEANLTLDNIGGTLSVSKGGTSLTTLTANRFLVGNGINAVDLTKVVPAGDVVGTTDTQTLTNKTATDASNNILARGLWYDSGSAAVSTYASLAPSSGDILVATSATTATWQTLSGLTYGSEFEYIEDLGSSQTTLLLFLSAGTVTGGTTKINWTTASKPIGTYRVDWSYNWTTDSSSRDLITLITVDGSTDSEIYSQTRHGVTSNAGGSDTDDFTMASSGTDQRLSSSGFFYITFGSAATHIIDLIFGRGTTGSGSSAVTIGDARMQIIRVS